MSLPLKKVSEIIDKHTELEKDLSTKNIDSKTFAKKSKEYSNLNEIISNALEYLNFEKIKDLEKIISDNSTDAEMKELANMELNELIEKNTKNELKLKIFLLPKDEADTKNAILEIRAGTGGLEASLFASDLFKMYERVCNKKNWILEVISLSRSDAGGLKEYCFYKGKKYIFIIKIREWSS